MTAIIGGLHFAVSDDDLRRVSETNPGWQFERADDGALLVSPTSTPSGAKSGAAFVQLHAYAMTAGGKAYDAATGFKTPQGGVVSPNAAWLAAQRVALHQDDDGFWQVMPDIAVEVAGKTDTWPTVKRKIDKYVNDGAGYAVALNPSSREVYERGRPPAGFVLDATAIIDA